MYGYLVVGTVKGKELDADYGWGVKLFFDEFHAVMYADKCLKRAATIAASITDGNYAAIRPGANEFDYDMEMRDDGVVYYSVHIIPVDPQVTAITRTPDDPNDPDALP